MNSPDQRRTTSQDWPLLARWIFRQERPPVVVAVVVGAAVGIVTGWGVGRALGLWGIVAGVALGVVLGGLSGLDLLLPLPDWAPMRDAGPRQRQVGPFRSAAHILLASLLALAAGVYFLGQLSCALQRQGDGTVACVRRLTLAAGWQRSEQRYAPVREATLDVHNEVLLATAAEHPEQLPGFGPDAAERINAFIRGSEGEAELRAGWIHWVSPLFFGISAVSWWLGMRLLRHAIGKLKHEEFTPA